MDWDIEAGRAPGTGPDRSGFARARDWALSPAGRALINSLAGTGYSIVKRSLKRKLDEVKARRAIVLPEKTGGEVMQSEGQRRTVTGTVRRRVNRFNWTKFVNQDNQYFVTNLGLRSPTGPTYPWVRKHAVSEFNPGTGGKICIATDSFRNHTPMHCYDLNFLLTSDTGDRKDSYPTTAVSGRNEDYRSRAWVWGNDNIWKANILGFTGEDNVTTPTTQKPQLLTDGDGEFRYYCQDPRTSPLPSSTTLRKVYRKGINVKFMAYGCRKMPTEMEFRIIRIRDPNMCPDNIQAITGDDLKTFQQNWQNMIRAWTQNPLLRGVEPQPKSVKKWFDTVAVKRVRIGEETADVETIPCVQGGLNVKLNSLTNYAWDTRNFSVESGDAAYDNIPYPDDHGDNVNFNADNRPYYTSRYYLIVRALSCVDTYYNPSATSEMGQDDTAIGNPEIYESFNYTPSYDIVVSTSWMVKKNGTA